MLYDDGEEEDLNMAQEQFQFCPPLPKLELDQQPGTEPQAQAMARQPTSKHADLATAFAGGHLVTDTAFDHQSQPCHHVGPPANIDEHSAGPIMSVKSCRPPQLACEGQGHAPHPIMASTSLHEGSGVPLHSHTQSVANAVGACEGASASQAAADRLPDGHPVSTEIRDDARFSPAKQLESPQRQVKPASDAYEYTASGAEATGAHQQLLNTRTDAQVGHSRGRGTGRKRLSVRQAAAAKRHKQLPSELRAHRGRKTVKQPAQSPCQATRLAKASSQKLASEDDAPASSAADAAEAGHTNSADQLLQQQQQAAPLQNCTHGELSDKSQLPQQQDLPKHNAAHQLQMAPSEQKQQQLSELAMQPKLPEGPAHVVLPAGHLPPPQRQVPTYLYHLWLTCHKSMNADADMAQRLHQDTALLTHRTAMTLMVHLKPAGMLQAAAMHSGKKAVVGSGLDRAKLDQIRRLCRRLRADACKAVDQHTTHVIVQVRYKCMVQHCKAGIVEGKLTVSLHVSNVSCASLQLCYNWHLLWAPILPLLTVPISLAPHLEAHADAQMNVLALHAASRPV